MAILTGVWSFFHFSMTSFTGLVREFLSKSLNLATFRLGVAFGAILQVILMNLVVELDAPLELHDICCKG